MHLRGTEKLPRKIASRHGDLSICLSWRDAILQTNLISNIHLWILSLVFMDRIFAPCINGHNMVHLKSSFFSRYATGFTTELSSFQNLTPDGSWNMISIYPPVFPNSITSLFYLFINLRFTDMNKLFFLISI
jgi:hypothetical protein